MRAKGKGGRRSRYMRRSRWCRWSKKGGHVDGRDGALLLILSGKGLLRAEGYAITVRNERMVPGRGLLTAELTKGLR